MKSTKLRRLLPILLTLLTVLVCTFGITAAADTDTEDARSGQIKYANLVLDNNVDLVFYVDVSEASAKSATTFMTFNEGKHIFYAGMRTIGGVEYAMYKYANILPENLGEIVTAKMYVDRTLTSVATYSVKDYCQKIINDEKSSDALKTLVSDLLCYGDEAQLLAGHDPETLVTNDISGLVPSLAPGKMVVVFGTEISTPLANAPASAGTSKVVMTDGVKIYFDVNLPEGADPSEYTACLSVNGREQEVKIVLDGYHYRAIFSGVYIHELFDNIQFTIYKGTRRVSEVISFSIVSYLAVLRDNVNLTRITEAYYNYAMSMHNYLEAHKADLPGATTVNSSSTSMYDSTATITYTCSVCGAAMQNLTATNIRDFEGTVPNGNLANNDNGKTILTVTTKNETLNGASNTYLSMIRDTMENKGSGAISYYITPAHTPINIINKFLDTNGLFTTGKYTLSFDVKAPAEGLTESTVYLRNSKAAATSNRYLELLSISPEGKITRGTTVLASADTVNADSWSNITVTVEFYSTNSTAYILIEYYLNNKLFASQAVSNPLSGGSFTDIYLAVSGDASHGQGIYFDNFVFAQGCARSFIGDIADYASTLGKGDIRKVVDMINNDFDIEQFSYVVRWDKSSGAEFTYLEKQGFVTFDTGAYMDPPELPTRYDHPRLLFSSSDIPTIVSNLEDPANEIMYLSFMDKARRNEDGILSPTDKTLTHENSGKFENTNYSTTVLTNIEAKALYYALYKNDSREEYSDAKLRGYEAIYAMKNYILTFDVQWDYSDQCRMYGETMYYAALVYDWCYDLLTDDDKDQFRLGVQNLCCDGTSNAPWLGETHDGRKLEGGFPALAIEHQSCLTGHGAEAQVLRDYFSFAVAIYDEDPSWYDYVGGMIYQDYVPARNYFYTSNYYPDGSAGYNVYRFLCDLYNAWIFKSMGVNFPYDEENMASVIHGLMSLETTDGFLFATADGSGTSSYGNYRFNRYVGDAALLSSYLFQDSTALAISHYINGEFSTNNSQLCVSIARYVILSSSNLDASDDYQEKIDNVEYHKAYAQQVVSRPGKGENDPVVFMQGAQHLPGGHTHQNAGSFQIWYKGMLTRDDGIYDAYGSDHHFYYHMSGTAHNTLLIYNSSLAESTQGPNANGAGYYNGEQKYNIGVSGGYDGWISNEGFSFGELIGMRTDDETNPTYVYYANDITKAYNASTIDYVERSTMTLYTGDEETPMVMFIFDSITADSADFQKTFLLQCVEAPVIGLNSAGDKTVTVSNGQGQMVLTSLLGADDIKAYGRTSKDGVVYSEESFRLKDADGNYLTDANGNYLHNDDYMAERFYLSNAGKNLPAGGSGSIGDRASDLNTVWGHIEVMPSTGNKTDRLMNVIYVTDDGKTVSATPTLVESEYLMGATFKNFTTMFVNDPMYSSNELSFTTTGDGKMTYYIGGLTEGTWKVSINGKEIGEFKTYDLTEDEQGNLVAKEDYSSRMISFEGEVGEVVLTPSEDMRPANSSLIYYYLEGGKLPEGSLNYYIKGETFVLPVPYKSGSSFLGWFRDPAFTQPITEIGADEVDVVRVYAQWDTPILDVDYSQGGSTSNYGQITHSPGTGGGQFSVINGKTNYLLWTTSGVNSLLTKDGSFFNLLLDSNTNLLKSYSISFTLTVGANEYDPLMPFSIYLRDTNVPAGSGNRYMNILNSDGNGNVYLGTHASKDYLIGKVTNAGMTTIRFVLDFENERVYAYDNDGKPIYNKTVKAGETAPDYYPMSEVIAMATTESKAPAYTSYKAWFEALKSPNGSIFTLKSMGAGSLRVSYINVSAGNSATKCKNYDSTSAMHAWDEGVVIKAPSTFNCTPGSMLYTCADCGITKEVPIAAEKIHDNLTQSYSGTNLVYECGKCGYVFKVESNYYLDGTNYNGIVGYGNGNNYTTAQGTHLPVISSGRYQLLNTTGKTADMELWIPSMGSALAGFSTANSANGFVSFKINALTEDTINFHFVDQSSDGARWSSAWCLTDSFFTVTAPKVVDGKHVVEVLGWDEIVLKSVETTSFTNWIDVMISINLDPTAKSITLNYYIDGVYVTSCTKAMTISTGAIDSICISGSTSHKDSGIILDDIGFGYTPFGTWLPKN